MSQFLTNHVMISSRNVGIRNPTLRKNQEFIFRVHSLDHINHTKFLKKKWYVNENNIVTACRIFVLIHSSNPLSFSQEYKIIITFPSCTLDVHWIANVMITWYTQKMRHPKENSFFNCIHGNVARWTRNQSLLCSFKSSCDGNLQRHWLHLASILLL